MKTASSYVGSHSILAFWATEGKTNGVDGSYALLRVAVYTLLCYHCIAGLKFYSNNGREERMRDTVSFVVNFTMLYNVLLIFCSCSINIRTHISSKLY